VLIAGDKKVNATAEWERERGNFFPLSHGETLNEIVKQVVFRLMAPYIYIYIYFFFVHFFMFTVDFDDLVDTRAAVYSVCKCWHPFSADLF
jgi:hypothetical protein